MSAQMKTVTWVQNGEVHTEEVTAAQARTLAEYLMRVFRIKAEVK